MDNDHRELMYRELFGGEIDLCRDLCNALMAHQADHGTIHPEVLRSMNFDNRLKPSYEHAAEKQLIAAFDGGTPVGYIFSTAEWQTEASKTAIPGWAQTLSGAKETGFYPDGLALPQKIGCLNNLYVMPEYRGRHIAYTLCSRAMQWFRKRGGSAYPVCVYFQRKRRRRQPVPEFRLPLQPRRVRRVHPRLFYANINRKFNESNHIRP